MALCLLSSGSVPNCLVLILPSGRTLRSKAVGRAFGDLPQHSRTLGFHPAVCEPKDMQAALFENPGPLRIIVGLLSMNISIEFHHKSSGVTIKINDKAVNHLLTPKM